MTNQKISFAIEKLDIINDGQDSEFATLAVWAFADGRNLHDTYVSNETLRKTASTIKEKPLVWILDKRFQDAGSHDDAEIPCGFIPLNTPLDFVEAEDGSGRIFLKVIGRIWKKYSQEILNFFARDDMTKSVSVEIDPLDVVENLEFGIPEIKDFVYNCVTILGDLISPAVKGARADIIAFAVKEKEAYLEVYQKEFSKYDDLDLSIPEKMKQNMQDGLDLYAEFDGEESAKTISLAVARYVTKNSQFTIEKLKQLQKYIPKNFKGNDLNSLLWGGFEGQAYFKDMSEKLAEIDSKKSSYFGGISEDVKNDNKFEKKEDTTQMTDKTEDKDFADEVVDMAKPVEGSPAEEKTESSDVENKEDMAAPSDDKSDDNIGEDKTYMSEKIDDVDMAEPTAKDPDEDGDDDTSAKTDTDKDNAGHLYQYSNDAYVDVMAALGFLQSQTETNNEIADEYKNSIQMAVAEMGKDGNCDFAKVCAGLYAYAQMCNGQMAKMSEEMMSLKEFKASEDSKAFEHAVGATMAEVKDVLPEGDYAEMIEESKKYSVDNLTGWQNLVRAKALPFALKSKPKTEEFPVKKYALVFDNVTPKKKTNFVWVK